MTKTIFRLFILILLVTACSPQPPAATSLPPTATQQPLTPETGLNIAWDAFEQAESYTAQVHEDMAGSVTMDTNCQVDVTRRTALQTADASIKFINNGRTAALFTDGKVYAADATGVYKPTTRQAQDLPCQPGISLLGVTAAHLKNAPSEYVGEVPGDNGKLYQYKINLPDNLLIKNSETAAGYSDISIYVDSQSGSLAKLSVTLQKFILNSFFYEQYKTTTTYSNWNSTDIQMPEVVQSDNVDLQTYNGQHANIVTFQFPMLNVLSEYDNGNFGLAAPGGDQLTWSTVPSWTLDDPDRDDETKAAVCRAYADKIAIPSVQETHPEAALEKAEWLKSERLGFCKINLSLSAGHQVLYVFNAPLDSAAQKMSMADKMERATFMLLVTPGSATEPDSAFAEVIQSIVFVK